MARGSDRKHHLVEAYRLLEEDEGHAVGLAAGWATLTGCDSVTEVQPSFPAAHGCPKTIT